MPLFVSPKMMEIMEELSKKNGHTVVKSKDGNQLYIGPKKETVLIKNKQNNIEKEKP